MRHLLRWLTVGVLSLTPVVGSSQWVTAYAPYWWDGSQAGVSSLTISNATHWVAFNINPSPNSAPYYSVPSSFEGWANQLIPRVHAGGRKVILSIGGIWGGGNTDMQSIANNASKSAVYAVAVAAYAKSKGYDGIELDWEFPLASDRVGFNRLNRLIRNELDAWPVRGTYILAAYARTGGATDSYFAYQRDSMVVYFDQINAMTYTMWQGSDQDYRSGFDTPVNAPTQFPNYNGYNLRDNGPLSFIAAGYPASKIGVSIPFEGTRFSGVTTMGQKYSAWAFCSSVTHSGGTGYASIPASGRQWDATAQAAWCVSGNTVYSFQTVQSATAISTWAKTNGFGGMMIWDYNAGVDVGSASPNALGDAVASVTLNGVIPPPPPVPPSGSISASPLTVPFPGDSVTLSYSSLNATSSTISQGVGAVTPNTSGSKRVYVNVSKTFTNTIVGAGGQTAYSVSVSVGPQPPPPVDSCASRILVAAQNADAQGYIRGLADGRKDTTDAKARQAQATWLFAISKYDSVKASKVCPPAVHDTTFVSVHDTTFVPQPYPVPVALTHADSVAVAVKLFEQSIR